MSDTDEAQWIAWYEQFEKPLYNVAYRWLWDAAESQDVVQEAFLKIWRIRHRVVAEGFKALIFRTTLRIASNRVRRRRYWRFVPLGEPDMDTGATENPDILASREVRQALDSLPESLRRVLLLSELGGLSYREVAEVLGIREGTVGSRRNRALAQLKKELASKDVEWHES
jgi:RNA polymerase sigma-70 factor (ECF subfamily)